MFPASSDKRVLARRRSMRLIFEAFFQALQDRPYEAVTVSDLIRRSGVARSTFYRHFSSVSDVAEGYFRHLDAMFDERTGGRVDFHSRDYLVKVFSIYREIGRRLLVYQNAGLSDLFIRAILDYHISNIGDMPTGSADRYVLYFYGGAIYCVASEWIVGGMKETREEIADIFLRCARRPDAS